MPAGAPRQRSSSTEKAGAPGAFASSAVEGMVSTRQRVAVALGVGSACARSTSTVTPDCSAASISRRDAVRSRAGALPHASINTAPSPAQRVASAAARNRAASSGTTASNNWCGARPSSNSPAACNRPVRRSAASVLSHSSGMAAPMIATMAAKPAALAESSVVANSSCT